MVLMIAAFLEGVAGRTAFTLSVPRFFAVLLLHPGDRLLKGFIRTLYFLSLTVFTNPFPRLFSDLCFSCDVLGTCLISTLFRSFLLCDLFDSSPRVFDTFSRGFTDCSSSFLHPFNYFFPVLLITKSIPFFVFNSSSLVGHSFARNNNTTFFCLHWPQLDTRAVGHALLLHNLLKSLTKRWDTPSNVYSKKKQMFLQRTRVMEGFLRDYWEERLLVKASLRFVSTASWCKLFQHRLMPKISGFTVRKRQKTHSDLGYSKPKTWMSLEAKYS